MSSQGPLLAGTGADNAGVGTFAWSNPGNVATASSYATSGPISSGGITHYVLATNFGFTIPPGATINGIVATISGHGSISLVGKDNSIKLVKGGTVQGTNQATAAFKFPFGSDATYTYGSSSNLWGLALLASDVNAANFGVAFSFLNTSKSGDTISATDATMTVYYTPSAGKLFLPSPMNGLGAGGPFFANPLG